ncbi:titin-like [Diadema antillarum]|uniref:titin-like n=1 Tax=Diadema antillarum TaxID=105358 RepID=UPI003A83FDCD
MPEEKPIETVKTETVETVMVVEPSEATTYIAIGNYLAESDQVMSMREGEQLTILDDSHGEWWMARRDATGEEGWVPKGYLATAVQYDDHLRSQLEEVVKEMPIDETPFEGEAVAPEILKPLETMKAKDGKPITMTCHIKGTPTPTLAWFRQSTPIPATEEFKMEYDGEVAKLTIEEVYPEDSGKYTCVAKNQAGTASTSAELLVEVALSDAESDGAPSRKSLSRESTIEEGEGIKPAFMTVAKSMVVESGREKVCFEFRLIAAPRPQIAWFKDDQPVEETPRRRMSMYADVHLYHLSLELTDIQPEDEGKYRIVATNKEGKAVASVSLEVTREEPEAPKFIEPIQSVQVPEGDTARFECVVTGRPMPEITWFHGEKMIKPTDLIEIGHDKEGKNWVVVRKAVPTLQGTFTCWAENQVGRTMCGADLTLASEAEEISMVSVDSSAIVEGPQSRDFEMSVDFEGVDELEEEGRPPSFAMPVQDVEVKPGETAHLRVKVAGKPTPEVTWYRDGKVLQPSPRHTIMSDTEGNASLVISEAQPGDDAEYLCKAVNPHGVVSCRADVIVEEEPSGVKVEKPTILIQPEAAAPLQAEPKAVAEAGLEVKGKELDITSLSEAPSITSEDAMEETDVEEKDEEEVEIHEAEDVTSPEVKLEIKMEDLEKHPEDVIQKVTQKREEEKPQKVEMVMPVEVTPLQEPVRICFSSSVRFP